MPYKYTIEMLCDKLAAGIVYQGEKWNKEYPIKYWNEREKEKRFQVYHNHRSSGSHGVVPFPAETGRAVYYRHSYRWRVQALGRGECEQMDDRKQRAVCRKVVENDG